MNKQNSISKVIHYCVILSFFLPFFFTGCGDVSPQNPTSNEDSTGIELESSELVEHNNDTIMPENYSDSSELENSKNESDNNTVDTAAVSPDLSKENYSLSQKIVAKYPFLSLVLIPKTDTYTGISLVIDSLPGVVFFGVFIAFLLIVLNLIIKYLQPQAIKVIVLINLISLIFLAIAHPYSIGSEKLWGYWISLTSLIFLFIYDAYLLRLSKK